MTVAEDKGELYVAVVFVDSSAAQAGVMQGDVVTHINRKEVRGKREVDALSATLKAGDEITLGILREGLPVEVKYTLGSFTKWTSEQGPDRRKLKNSGDPAEGSRTRDYEEEDFTRMPLPRDPNRLPRSRLEELASKAGSGVAWFDDLEEALKEAKSSGRPILWYGPKWPTTATYGDKDYDYYMRTTVFTEPGAVDLLNRNFVCYRDHPKKSEVRKRGLQDLAVVEPFMLFLSPEGEPIHLFDRISTFHEDLFHQVLRGVLKKQGRSEDLGVRDGDTDSRVGEVAQMRLYLCEGELARAQGLGERILEEAPQGPYAAEILSRLADVAWLRKEDQKAVGLWRRLVEAFPETPFGAEAAVALLGKHPLQHNVEVLGKLPGAELEGLPAHTHRTVPESEAPRLVRQALENLIRWQRSSGQWNDSPYDWPSPEHRPNTYFAITALCATTLWQWHDRLPEGGQQALALAEGVLRDHGYLGVTAQEKVYGYTYALLYWAGVAGEGKGPQQGMARREGERLVAKLAQIQSASGTWGHEYLNPFTTSTVLRVLAQAKEIGMQVPESMMTSPVSSLLKIREGGGFPYHFNRTNAPLGASTARSPVCEYALYLQNPSIGTDTLEAAIRHYTEHISYLESLRQFDFHTGRYGEGGHLFFYSFYPVTLALDVLPEQTAKGYRKQLLGAMLGYPEVDGSFIDSPNIGKSYGTAMGLLILKKLLG
jgi:hypothetical protein